MRYSLNLYENLLYFVFINSYIIYVESFLSMADAGPTVVIYVL